MQPFDPSFENLVPTPLAAESRIDHLEVYQGVDRAGRHEPDLALLQIATLGQDNEIIFLHDSVEGLSWRGQAGIEDRNKTARQVVALPEGWVGPLCQKRFPRHSSPASSS